MKDKIIFILFVLFTSCNFSDEKNELSGDCRFYSEGTSNNIIMNGERLIPCDILKYGYNDEFIIVEQKPTKDCFIGEDTLVYNNGRETTYYWIIQHSSKLMLGPLTLSEFELERRKLKVPEDLELGDI